jgi:hypothetical protein
VRMKSFRALSTRERLNRTITGATKKYKGVPTRMIVLRAQMKALRAACNRRARAKAAAAN